MPLTGVICGRDGQRHSFDECLMCHRTGIGSCDAPEALIYAMSQEGNRRQNVGVSATTLLQCARAVALKELYPYYEDVQTAWNKFRGTLIHAMFEHGSPPRPGIIRERRIEHFVTVDGIEIQLTGQVDEVDTERHLLVDYKSTHLIPKKVKNGHEEQLNIYIWLLANGTWQTWPEWEHAGETCNIRIKHAGIHYVNLDKLKGGKKSVRVWNLQDTEDLVLNRLQPIADWKRTGALPECNAYTLYGKNPCDCVKIEKQLLAEGIAV